MILKPKTADRVVWENSFKNKQLEILPLQNRRQAKQKKIGWIVLDQIRTIDRQRIVKLLGILDDKEVSNFKAFMKETNVG